MSDQQVEILVNSEIGLVGLHLALFSLYPLGIHYCCTSETC